MNGRAHIIPNFYVVYIRLFLFFCRKKKGIGRSLTFRWVLITRFKKKGHFAEFHIRKKVNLRAEDYAYFVVFHLVKKTRVQCT